MGLSQVLFWRVAVVLAAALGLIAAFTYTVYEKDLYRAWQADLLQEAEWTVRHWPVAAAAGSSASGARVVKAADLARAWRATHDAVRLTVRNERGEVVLDSHPERIPVTDTEPALAGRAPIRLLSGTGELVLSRREPVSYPLYLHLGLVLGGLLIALLAAAAVLPVVQSLRGVFDRLSSLARRVADGDYGASLELSGRRELDALISALNDMSQRLAVEDGRRRRLITDVSHELRSPLARLRALSETIGRHPSEATVHLGAVEAEIGLIDRLVEDLLQTARLEEGQSIRTELVNLKAWAEDAFARVAMRLEQAEVAVMQNIAVPSTIEVMMDPQRMIQALGNLAENAINATGGHPHPQVAMALRVVDDQWILTVSDNGQGVPAKDLPFLFDRFFRVAQHRTRDGGGVGLGLGLVKAIAQAHGGDVRIENAEGAGATARMFLPLNPAPTLS